jgi:hypothetical protein
MTQSEILNTMKLLDIKEVTSRRQARNGTREFELPIKNYWPGNQKNATFIRVASFKTGYVRNQNSCSSNYQLNKRCEGEPQYFDSGKRNSMGKPLYTQWTTRTCKLIPNELDRLQYLLRYCIKNYYIRHANFVANGDYIPKWRYDNLEEKRILQDISVTIDGQRHTLQTQETLKI